jgi:SAM-dependent methyltransferase
VTEPAGGRALTPAEIYERDFVPALFRSWGPVLVEAAEIRPGQRVLDVACGTGVLARAAADRVGPGGSVVGLDANEDMLSVARRRDARVEWRSGRAESLPFPQDAFDAVVSQFGLMFFEDRAAALREMHRVVKPGGRIAVAVWDAVERSPGYGELVRLLERLFDESVARAFRAPFVLADPVALRDLAVQAGFEGVSVEGAAGTVTFPSIDALIATERACVWTLGGLLDDAQFARLRAEANRALRPFVQADGTVSFAVPALLLRGGKAGKPL